MSQFTSRFRAEAGRFLALKFIGPFLLVPVLLIASLVIESRMQESGIIAYIQVGKRSGYSIWRVVMLACMVGTPLSSLFMSDSWKQDGASRSFPGWYAATILTCFLFLFLAMTALTFLLLPPLAVPVGFIASHVFVPAAVTAFWAVSAAALCSSLTSGQGAAVLSLGLFSLGLFPGLSGTSMNWLFMGPLGDMLIGIPYAMAAVAAHGLFYSLFSYILLRKTIG